MIDNVIDLCDRLPQECHIPLNRNNDTLTVYI